MLKSIRFWVIFTFGMAISSMLIGFAYLNRQPIVVDFYFAETEPLWLWAVIFSSAAVGFVFALLFSMIRALSTRSKLSKLMKEKQRMEEELNHFRNQPLSSSAIFEQRSDVTSDSGPAV